ncbi:MAG: AAA family ATPase, partial [Candidatus Entotheonellia bacterium]
GARAHADVLLVGKTGSGKTKLAVKVMEALFGKDGYYSKTTLPSMSPTDFMDIDFRGIKAGTKTLQQAIEGVPALILPGIVLNEANRAPPVVQSMLIPFLDREFEIEGKPLDVGVLHKGERYQYRILTINEKSEGYAVEEFDPALRDRAVFQIPMDVFPQSEYDVQVMLQSLTQTSPQGAVAQTFPSTGPCPTCRGVAVKRTGHDDGRWQMRCESCQGEWTEPDRSQFPVVLKLYEYLRGIPVAPIAGRFLVYLSGLSNCVRSRTGYKEGILFDPGTHCHECHHSRHFHNTNVCGDIRAPSARALVNLQRVAQGFALLRAWKGGHDSVSVTLDDLIAAGPFVLRGKLHLSSAWLQTSGPPGKPFQGCEWEAIRVILDWLRKHFEEGFCSTPEYTLLARRLRGEGLSAEDVERLIRYADDRDNWAVNKVHMERYKTRVIQGEHRP